MAQMEDDSQSRELLKSLAEDVAESASYLRELGVEGLEGLDVQSLEAPAHTREESAKAQAPFPDALRRNATAERPATTLPPPPQRQLPPPPPPTSQAARPKPAGASLPPPLQTKAEMPKRPVRK